ncbi:HAD hydrolase family protein [Campylobacter concisus]
MSIHFVTGDHRGFEITKARIVDDMKMPLDLVSTIKRIDWIKERWNPNEVIYMGDGIFDHYVFKNVMYSIAPANSSSIAKSYASYVTKTSGSERAVAEASLHILEKFLCHIILMYCQINKLNLAENGRYDKRIYKSKKSNNAL